MSDRTPEQRIAELEAEVIGLRAAVNLLLGTVAERTSTWERQMLGAMGCLSWFFAHESASGLNAAYDAYQAAKKRAEGE